MSVSGISPSYEPIDDYSKSYHLPLYSSKLNQGRTSTHHGVHLVFEDRQEHRLCLVSAALHLRSHQHQQQLQIPDHDLHVKTTAKVGTGTHHVVNLLSDIATIGTKRQAQSIRASNKTKKTVADDPSFKIMIGISPLSSITQNPLYPTTTRPMVSSVIYNFKKQKHNSVVFSARSTIQKQLSSMVT